MKKLTKFLPLLLAAALLLWFCLSLFSLNSSQREAGAKQLETAIRRSAAACYAQEGIYPPDLAYLQQHYGLQLDESRYRVFYEIFGDNIMPQITVLER